MAGFRTPGPQCSESQNICMDEGTLALTLTPPPGPVCSTNPQYQAPTSAAETPLDDNTRLLAAVAYGEASTQNVFEEIAAIANVLVRQQKARGYASVKAFVAANKTYAFAAYDGNARYKQLMNASAKDIAADPNGMGAAVRAATNALSAAPTDYANGAYFWDGADIKSNYANHPKVADGIHFTDAKHNIYNIAGKSVPGEEWWRDTAGKKTKLRGKWDYKYESTAAYGGTIFWKYNADFLKATGNKEYN